MSEWGAAPSGAPIPLCRWIDTGRRKDMAVVAKDDKNLKQVLERIAGMDEPARAVMRRMHDVIVAAAPELKPRI